MTYNQNNPDVGDNQIGSQQQAPQYNPEISSGTLLSHPLPPGLSGNGPAVQADALHGIFPQPVNNNFSLVDGTSQTLLAGSPNEAPAGYKTGPAYYASPDGHGNGLTPNNPTSIQNAQRMMEHSNIKTVDLEAGNYNLSQSISLTGADNGETWQYYRPQGVDSAVLNGGSTNPNNGISDIIDINGASNVTIDGLTMKNFRAYGINGTSSANSPDAHDTIENNNISHNTITSWSSAGIAMGGWVPDTTIANNYVHDVGSQGIALFDNWSGQGGHGNVGGTVIENNVVLRAVQRMSDGGDIYMEMHGGDEPTNGGVVVKDNYVGQQGTASTWGAEGIYLDENSNHVTVEGNVIGAPNPQVGDHSSPQGYTWNNTNAIAVNTGHDNTIVDNLINLGNSGKDAIAGFYNDGNPNYPHPSGNTVEHNIIESSYTGKQRTVSSGVSGYAYYDQGSGVNITDNLYFNSAGGKVDSSGTGASDSHPIIANPEIQGITYQIAQNSPAFRSPINFRPLHRDWGPPGFQIARALG